MTWKARSALALLTAATIVADVSADPSVPDGFQVTRFLGGSGWSTVGFGSGIGAFNSNLWLIRKNASQSIEVRSFNLDATMSHFAEYR